ncbi:hypothetical protein EMIT0P294_140101 [Pseudomonas sp. IT-P294]
MVHVAEQCLLEIGITAEPEFFDQAHDGRIADTGMFGQARHRPQPIARVLVQQGTDDLAFRWRQFQARIGDQVSKGGHPGSLLDEVSVSFHKLLKQYLCSTRYMSSEFSRGFLTPRNGAKTASAVGYTDDDWVCSPSPIKLSEIAEFHLLDRAASAWYRMKRNALDRTSCGTIEQIPTASSRSSLHRQGDYPCRRPV